MGANISDGEKIWVNFSHTPSLSPKFSRNEITNLDLIDRSQYSSSWEAKSDSAFLTLDAIPGWIIGKFI